jgi:antitoxin (DNA-binding transcriptional repressor) of toxin-antitoxin stability system
VRFGKEVIMMDQGRPVARRSPVDRSIDQLAELVAAGVVRPPTGAARHRPRTRIRAKDPVSALVAEQRQ